MEFKVVSRYQPAGDQPSAINSLDKIMRDKHGRAVLMGVTGSGKTMTMAHVIERVKRPVIVITHNKTLAAQLYREFKDYFPDNAVEYFVSYYDYYQPEAYIPVSDTFIEKDAAINDEIEMLRLRTTSSLLERDDVIVVASVSCIYGLGSPEDYSESVLLLHKGQNISREETITNLVRMLYERNDTELQRGKFRVRGDVLEVFPAYTQDVLRLEFFGNQLELINKIDRITGKKKEEFEKTAIYPSKHFITSPPKLMEAIKEIKNELTERVQYFKSIHKPLEAERIQQRTLYDIEMLREMGYCSGIENYSRHLTRRAPGSRAACLLDYFPKDFLMIIDESHVSIPQIGGMYAGDRSRKETLVEFGFRLPSALDNRPLNFGEFEEYSKNVLYVSATPSDYEINRCEHVIEQIIRPTGLLDPVVEIRKTEGQIDDLLIEIQKRVKKNQRVLITTLTKKMAEDLTDYYADLGIRIRYMHSEIVALERLEIIRDLRKGEFDVLVGINLLREGLDLPEVSLVAILDADKEGFLRSRRSLIQTMGRAARNSDGIAILYADKITDSMKAAIDETRRRREIQEKHNIEYGITPTTIEKDVVDIIDRIKKEEEHETGLYDEVLQLYHPQNFKSKKDWQEKLKAAMIAAAEDLDFEKAAMIRDLLLSGHEEEVDFD
ncbi:MAG: excinuclease ABC subunit UvrB [Spirochaetia bacterium]|nr:excinuclease ABC subunit UvrB [Spirochaetia bacterium]